MSESKVEAILQEIPFELRSALKSLSDDTRFAIILALLKNGEMSFSQLAQAIGIPSNILSHHLGALAQAALVRNYYAKKGGSDEYSFYDATATARDFTDKVFSAMVPRASVTDLVSHLLTADQKYSRALIDLLSATQDYREKRLLEGDSITLLRYQKVKLLLPTTG